MFSIIADIGFVYIGARKNTVSSSDIPAFKKKLDDFRTAMLSTGKGPSVYDL